MRRMFQALCVVGVGAAAGSAAAKPLPPGIKLAAVKGRLVITQGGVSLTVGEQRNVDDTFTASLSDDGKTIQYNFNCELGQDPHLLPLTTVTAMFENYAGMALHLKKKYAEAIPHFATAAAAAPDDPVYATNLLSAQSMGGKLDDADATIQTYAGKHPGWFGWRINVDSDLAALRARPSTQRFHVATRGSVTWAKLGVAVSPLGIVAAGETDTEEGNDQPTDTFLTLEDLTTGETILRLPITGAASRAAADALLAQLGFTPVKTTKTDDQPPAQTATLGKATVTLGRSVDQKNCIKTYSQALSVALPTP